MALGILTAIAREVVYENDPERYFADGGAAEAWLSAKQQGKVKFIGFTGHKRTTKEVAA